MGLDHDSGARHVAIVSLDAPERRNALGDEDRRALLSTLRRAMDDPSTYAIVLTGREDVFCAGGELHSMPSGDASAARARIGELHDIVRLLIIGPKPVVAAVEGPAFGSGMALAAACDHVVAGTTASFQASFGRVGLIADTGLLWTLPQRVGVATARRLLMFATTIGADSALRMGMCDTVVEAGHARDAAVEVAAGVMGLAPTAVSRTKSLMNGEIGSLEMVLALELEEQVELLASTAFAEGKAAFLEKREPDFTSGNSDHSRQSRSRYAP